MSAVLNDPAAEADLLVGIKEQSDDRSDLSHVHLSIQGVMTRTRYATGSATNTWPLLSIARPVRYVNFARRAKPPSSRALRFLGHGWGSWAAA